MSHDAVPNRSVTRPALADFSLAMDLPTQPTDPSTSWTTPGSAPWRRALLTPPSVTRVLEGLAAAGAPLAEISDDAILAAWQRTLEELIDPGSESRRSIDGHLAAVHGLSPPALQGALESVLEGVMGEHARALFQQAALEQTTARTPPRPLLVVLASNIPALAVQALLPALALRRPVLLKSASAEPLFVPLLLERLVAHEPRLRPGLAALTWPGGEGSIEEVVLAGVGRVVAYGGGDAMDDLRRRAGGKLIAFGPKLSLAIVGAEVDPRRVAPGLARDIALFEQRGCLSIQWVVTFGDPRALAEALAEGLRQLASSWPRVPSSDIPLDELSALRQLRDEATMRGLYQPSLGLDEGTVIVEDPDALKDPEDLDSRGFEPSPGGRCVRIYPVADEESLAAALAPWRDRLQGVALAGEAWRLAPSLRALGVSRLAEAGELQQPDSSWRNGGISLLEALADDTS